VVVQVTLDGTQPRLEAQEFEVSGAQLEGRRLRATFRHVPTGVTTTSDLTLVSPSRLEGTVSGAYSGRETWLRVEADAGPLLPYQPPPPPAR
jgi:hypothetical protein